MYISSASKQNGSIYTTSHSFIQLDQFALKMTIYRLFNVQISMEYSSDFKIYPHPPTPPRPLPGYHELPLQLSIQPLICAPGTHNCWVAKVNVDSQLAKGLTVTVS